MYYLSKETSFKEIMLTFETFGHMFEKESKKVERFLEAHTLLENILDACLVLLAIDSD